MSKRHFILWEAAAILNSIKSFGWLSMYKMLFRGTLSYILIPGTLTLGAALDGCSTALMVARFCWSNLSLLPRHRDGAMSAHGLCLYLTMSGRCGVVEAFAPVAYPTCSQQRARVRIVVQRAGLDRSPSFPHPAPGVSWTPRQFTDLWKNRVVSPLGRSGSGSTTQPAKITRVTRLRLSRAGLPRNNSSPCLCEIS